MIMKSAINPFEMAIYYCVWTSMIFWVLYKLYETQTDIFTENPFLRFTLRDLSNGWTFLDRKRDVSDIDWGCWKHYIQTLWPYLTLQFAVSETLRQFNPLLTKCWYIISSVIVISFYMGFTQLLLIIIPPIVFLIVILCGGKRITIWVTAIIFFSIYSSSNCLYYFWKYANDKSQIEKSYLFLIALSWTNLRCISFCLDFVEKQRKVLDKEGKYSKENILTITTNLFSYIVYLPVLWTGPIILYEDFEKSFQYESKPLRKRLKIFIVDMMILISYSCLLDLALHFFYFKAMRGHMKLIEQLPSIALAGAGMWMLFVFQTIYVVIYGSTSAFARLDNIEAPATPRCFARLHLNSNMWKYVDVGFYNFMLKYLYKPCTTALQKYNQPSFVCKQIGSLLSFLFIFLWHKMTTCVSIWCILNFTIVFLENSGKAVSKMAWYNTFKTKILLTDAMEIRFIAFLSCFLLPVTAISMIYFFGGTAVGNVYIELIKWPEPHNFALLLIASYCCCQVSINLIDVPSRTDSIKFRVR